MFYLIRDTGFRTNRYASKDLSFEGIDYNTCSLCNRKIASFRYRNNIHELILEGGKRIPDKLQFCGAGRRLFLVSEAVIRAIESFHISGVLNYSPVILNPSTKEMPYYSIDVSGEIELSLSNMALKKKNYCPQCTQFEWNRKGFPQLCLDASSWNGQDICIVKSVPGYFVCTSKFAKLIEEHGFTGFDLLKVSHI